MEVCIGEGDEPGSPMVGEVQEHIVPRCRLQHPPSPLPCHCRLVAFQHVLEDGRSDIPSSVVDLYSLVDIDSGLLGGRLVEDLALEGVFDVMGDIVVGEGDDVVGVKLVLDEDLVGVEDIRLMPVVGVGVGACDQDGPVGGVGLGEEEGHKRNQ